jgi:carbon monoxide dehydrogenase subunit G
MKNLRLLLAACAACVLTAVTFASDPTGTWKWTVTRPDGEIATTAKLAAKDGQVTGTYSNTYGDGVISSGTVKDSDVAFKVERDINGSKLVLQYQGKQDGDTIKGTIQISGGEGGDGSKLEWNAKREAAAKP